MVGWTLPWPREPSNVENINYIYDDYAFYSSACSIQLGPYTIVTGGEYTLTAVSKYNIQVRRAVI